MGTYLSKSSTRGPESVPSCRAPHWPGGGRTEAPSPCVPERRESEGAERGQRRRESRVGRESEKGG